MSKNEQMYCVCVYTDMNGEAKLLGFVEISSMSITPYDENNPMILWLLITSLFTCEMGFECAYMLAAFLNTFYRSDSDNYYFKVMQKEYIYKNIGELDGVIKLYYRV